MRGRPCDGNQAFVVEWTGNELAPSAGGSPLRLVSL